MLSRPLYTIVVSCGTAKAENDHESQRFSSEIDENARTCTDLCGDKSSLWLTAEGVCPEPRK